MSLMNRQIIRYDFIYLLRANTEGIHYLLAGTLTFNINDGGRDAGSLCPMSCHLSSDQDAVLIVLDHECSHIFNLS